MAAAIVTAPRQRWGLLIRDALHDRLENAHMWS
jgi:hypothetical protein